MTGNERQLREGDSPAGYRRADSAGCPARRIRISLGGDVDATEQVLTDLHICCRGLYEGCGAVTEVVQSRRQMTRSLGDDLDGVAEIGRGQQASHDCTVSSVACQKPRTTSPASFRFQSGYRPTGCNSRGRHNVFDNARVARRCRKASERRTFPPLVTQLCRTASARPRVGRALMPDPPTAARSRQPRWLSSHERINARADHAGGGADVGRHAGQLVQQSTPHRQPCTSRYLLALPALLARRISRPGSANANRIMGRRIACPITNDRSYGSTNTLVSREVTMR
ncbi:hypothetical protein H4696_003438 [Amycolatopsis lexingtonensis]|uniref:Uncharacterized protein n=2 Tax=Amycolatopsis lexingtonensis TaxID=218822 RepID=A0ABR9HZJ0_9PSEU|nr:hypothetical protein [Amycolatopsis lexingtonensis]